jgi:hypothetical protein
MHSYMQRLPSDYYFETAVVHLQTLDKKLLFYAIIRSN